MDGLNPAPVGRFTPIFTEFDPSRVHHLAHPQHVCVKVSFRGYPFLVSHGSQRASRKPFFGGSLKKHEPPIDTQKAGGFMA